MNLEDAIKQEPDAGSALTDLYTRHSGQAFALAYLLTGARTDAEDLVQEAFLRLAGRFSHLRNQEAFGAYLRRTIVNLHVSQLRRKRRERAALRFQEDVPEEYPSFPDLEQHEELLAALRRLPPRQRAAVVLRYCLDLSEAQVAEALRCSLAAARGLIGRGVRTLRTGMGGDGYA